MSASPLDLAESAEGTDHVIAARGEIDISSAPELAACLDSMLDRGVEKIVVDLSGASFLDSSGVFTLVRAKNRAQESGGSLRVTCPPGPVLRVLTVAGLIEQLGVSAPDAG